LIGGYGVGEIWIKRAGSTEPALFSVIAQLIEVCAN
jgi:hypothetical protein